MFMLDCIMINRKRRTDERIKSYIRKYDDIEGAKEIYDLVSKYFYEIIPDTQCDYLEYIDRSDIEKISNDLKLRQRRLKEHSYASPPDVCDLSLPIYNHPLKKSKQAFQLKYQPYKSLSSFGKQKSKFNKKVICLN